MSLTAQITELNIYPVKSLKGIAVDKARVTEKGFAFDRHWMIVNPKGQFLSQRQLPQMAQIETQLTESALVLKHFAMSTELTVALDSSPTGSFKARVWKNEVDVLDEGVDASQWLTEALQTAWPVRLVKMASDETRVVDQSEKQMAGKQSVVTEFADGFPYLIANQASLDCLNRRLDKAIPMDRFRPNIVIDSEVAFGEHGWSQLQLRDIIFSLRYPCERCVITTIDQQKATKDVTQEPLRSLIEINPMPGKKAAAFGENAELISGVGQYLSVGDRFTVSAK